MPSYNCGLYSSRAVAYSSRTQSQIDTFSVLHLLHDSLNVWTETIGFTTIRKIVDEHKLITAIYWVSYELEMRVSRLRRLTCTASAFLKRFLPIAWVDLKSEYTDFKMRFLKKKKLWSASPITIIDASMKNFDVLFKIRCQACHQIFLDVCSLNLKFRTHKIKLFAWVQWAKCSPKISFLLLS